MNCPTVPPTGYGIQVQLPPFYYKASHVSSINFRLQLMVKSLQLSPKKQQQKKHTAKVVKNKLGCAPLILYITTQTRARGK